MSLKNIFAKIKLQLLTLWYAIKHPKTPAAAKYLAMFVCAYAFSPIDLIPDFIPVLGYLDDLILIPCGVYLVFKLLPENVLLECQQKAFLHLEQKRAKPKSYAGLIIIITLWLLILYGIFYLTTPTGS